MLRAMMLLTISAASHGRVERLPWQAGTSETSHSGPGWAAARERGAQPHSALMGQGVLCPMQHPVPDPALFSLLVPA